MDPSALSAVQIALLLGSIALAYFLRGLSGFGSALIAVPLLAHVLPLSVVVPVVAMLDSCASAEQGIRHRQKIVWRDLLTVVPLVVTGMAIGLYFLNTLNTGTLQIGLGVMLVAYALLLLSGYLPRRRQPIAMALPFGAAGGFVSSLLGAGGPFYVIYLQLRQHGALQFRATVAAIFVIDGVVRLAGYLLSGMLDPELLLAAAFGLPVMAGAMYLGNRCHDILDLTSARRVISVVLVASGLSLLAQ